MKSSRSDGPADPTKATTSAMLQFSLDEAKSEVIKELQAILPSSVKRIMKEPTYDSFVTHCLLYFIVTFQKELLQKGLEKAQKQHMDNYDPVAAVVKVASLEQDAAKLKAGMSPLYAMIVMRFSSYQHVNRDRLFFEGFYITIINICDDALNALGKRSEIELFLGELFRGRHFNLYRRINAPPRSIDTLSLKEVYAIKHETANRALNSKLLSSLNSRPQMLNISAASVNNSPLISDFISSVITSRALIKDPQFRKSKMSANPNRNKTKVASETQSCGQQGTRPTSIHVGTTPSAADISATPTAYPQGSLQGKLPSNGLQTETTSGNLDTSSTADLAPRDHPAGDVGNKQFVGTGFENLSFLYDETMADLEDLREYCLSGRHPKLEMRKMSRRTMTRADSSQSMKCSSGSGVAE